MASVAVGRTNFRKRKHAFASQISGDGLSPTCELPRVRVSIRHIFKMNCVCMQFSHVTCRTLSLRLLSHSLVDDYIVNCPSNQLRSRNVFIKTRNEICLRRKCVCQNTADARQLHALPSPPPSPPLPVLHSSHF